MYTTVRSSYSPHPSHLFNANREISVGRSSSGNEVELTTTPGTATSSMGGGGSFTEWPPLPPEVRGCPDYPYPHSHSTEFRQGESRGLGAGPLQNEGWTEKGRFYRRYGWVEGKDGMLRKS